MKQIMIVGDKDPIEKWLPFAEEFVKHGYKVNLCFYYRNKKNTEEYEISKGIRVYIIRNFKQDTTEISEEEAEKILGIASLPAFLFTECRLYDRVYNDASDELLWMLEILSKKYNFEDFDFILQNQGAGILRRLIYHLSKLKGIENIYFNVNWFPGRSFYQRNEMNILENYSAIPYTSIQEELKEYIRRFMKSKTLTKESYKYRFGRRKGKKSVPDYLKKVSEKSILKSIGYRLKRIPKLFRSFFIMLVFDKLNYNRLPDNTAFFFFPLHYQKDSQMTLRNHAFIRQYALIEYIAWNLPSNVILCVKPHPQAKGDYFYNELNTIRKTHNVVLLKTSISSHTIMSKSNFRGLITLNSSVGFESLCYKKPVITLGDFYGIDYPRVIIRAKLNNVSRIIYEVLYNNEINDEDYVGALASIYLSTLPGEFYTTEIDYPLVCQSVFERLKTETKT